MNTEVEYEKIFGWPESLQENPTHYCPGCGHSVAHRLVAECIDEMGLRGKTIGVPPVGCAVLAQRFQVQHDERMELLTDLQTARNEGAHSSRC